MESQAKFVSNWELQGVSGVVVAVGRVEGIQDSGLRIWPPGQTSNMLSQHSCGSMELARSIPGLGQWRRTWQRPPDLIIRTHQ